MTFLELKPLTTEQLPAVVELDQLCFGGLWTLEGYQRELLSPNSDLLILELGTGDWRKQIGNEENEGQENEQKWRFTSISHPQSLVGLGCFWSILDEAHITLLAVHPDYRGAGLGFLMLVALLRLACRRGLERATLEVKASNHPALSLYHKFGFQEAGRRRRYYKDTGEDALILWRGDLQTPEFAKNLEEWYNSVGDRFTKAGWKLSEIGINSQV